MPLVGFLPPTDERMLGTVAAIERELCHGGLVHRYSTSDDADSVDGLPEGEGTFLACSFWLAANYALSGRLEEARALFERLLSLRNDVGLLAEEYDPETQRQVGNFPQAFSHVPLIMAAHLLGEAAERGLDALAETDRPRRGARHRCPRKQHCDERWRHLRLAALARDRHSTASRISHWSGTPFRL